MKTTITQKTPGLDYTSTIEVPEPTACSLILGPLVETEWGQRILAAEKSGAMTENDRLLADKWTNCACGGADSRIPTKPNGEPLDRQLARLGFSFYFAVREASGFQPRRDSDSLLGTEQWSALPPIAAASHILVAIERRATEILGQMANSINPGSIPESE